MMIKYVYIKFDFDKLYTGDVAQLNAKNGNAFMCIQYYTDCILYTDSLVTLFHLLF